MICHIVQNGGYMLLILCLWISTSNSYLQENIKTIQEFCSDNLYIHNIEPGDTYKLILKTESAKESSDRVVKWHRKSKRKCWQEFKTSNAAAHFVVFISNMSIPSCNKCRCSYFEISVSGHSKRYCGKNEELYFSSKSDKLSILFYHRSTERFDVTLTFAVERNAYIITGTPKDGSDSSTFIETPYFPSPYPQNYRAEYILQSDEPDSHVLLLFLDFQFSAQSFIEVIGNNGTHPTRFYGNVFRPPAIVSQLSRLAIKFVSNDDQAGMPGFRAVSSFIKNVDSHVVPYTDCSGSLDGRGGYIDIKTHEGFALYDCIWHISHFTLFTKSNLSVSTQLENVGYKSSMEFRSGLNSKSQLIREINCEIQNCNALHIEIVVPASDNLYIRFNGYLDVFSIINISYSTYHTGDCSNKEFRCEEDGRCLLSDFRCDGIKQCPNGTDEENCPSPSVFDNQVPLHPNLQDESFHDDVYTKFIIVVLLGTFGLLTVCVSVCIFIYNFCKRIATTEPLVSQQSAGEMSDVPPTLYPVNVHDCDSPPSYEDFIKSSDYYPPLLFTRAKQRFISKDKCIQCTTSFCTDARIRHYSADSFNLRNSDTDNSDIFLNITGDVTHRPPSSSGYNVEIIQNNLAFKTSRHIKRSYSLDSKLNELVNQDSCHFLLSIVHPVCTHMSNQLPHVQCQTLPPNFKMSSSAVKNCGNSRQKTNQPHWSPESNVNFCKDRRFTWSFVPRSSIRSELLTVVKTRCFSDPCNGISVHCSLY